MILRSSIRLLAVIGATSALYAPLAAGAGCDLPMFGGARLFSSDSGSRFVTTGDLNLDGLTDLVVVNAASISILLGNGDGTFQPAVNYKMPNANWAGIADFNGDGNPDLIVQSGFDSVVMLGNGDGTFRTGTTISSIQAIAVGDFNGDGKPDLVVTGMPVGIMLGKGDGTFFARVNAAGGPTDIANGGAAVGDINGDGKLDVVTGSFTGGVFALLGDGKGGLAAPVKFGTDKENAFPNQVALADLNGDHKLDVVVLDGEIGQHISVYLGTGSGSFQAATMYPLGSITLSTSLVVADLNGDGVPDVAATVDSPATPGAIVVFLGKGDGTLQSPVSYVPTGQVSYSLAVGDFNGDGLPDVVFPVGNQAAVIFGKSDGTLQSPGGYGSASGGTPGTPVMADFNGDGKPDLAVLIYSVNAGNNLLTFLGRGDGTFQPAGSYPTAALAEYMAVGDFNGDGKPDLIVSNGFSGNVLVFPGVGDGTFGAPIATSTLVPVGVMAVGDFNKDGKLDVATGGLILLGKGDGTFNVSFASINVTAAADLNGDGNLDVVAAKSPSSVTVYLGNGDGTFRNGVDYPAGPTPQWIAIGDFNGDGKPDLAVTNLTAATISLLFGNGDGTFQAPVAYPLAIGKSSINVAAGDWNGDGFLDLAVLSTGSGDPAQTLGGAVTVLLGNGDGTFRNELFYGAGNPLFAAVGDVNGDGLPDLMLSDAAASGSAVRVMLNAYVPGGGSACSPVAAAQ